MKTMLLHFSDLHFKKNSNPIFDKFNELIHSFSNEACDCEQVYMIFSGDIANKGKEDEYLEATQFIEQLVNELQHLPCQSVNCIFVPGNHDCDFEKDTGARKTIRDSVCQNIDRQIDETIIEQCTQIQGPFFQFLQAIDNLPTIQFYNSIYWTYSFKLWDINIRFRCFNTAWLTDINERLGYLFIPKEILDKSREDNDGININVFHHPFPWLNPDHRREVVSIFESSADLLLCGHEHYPEQSKRYQHNFETWYFDGGVLQNHSNENESNFNLIFLNYEDQEQVTIESWKMEWDGNKYIIKETTRRTELSAFYALKNHSGLKLSKNMRSFIEDPGANYQHPNISNLTLKDLFVYPDLAFLDIESQRKNPDRETKSAESIINFHEERMHIALLGNQKSGKTSLLKVYYDLYYKQGLLPIWINGEKIKTTKNEEIRKFINHHCYNQYEIEDYEYIRQLPDRQKVLIIDDLQLTKLNRKYRKIFLEKISSLYSYVIFTANSLFEIEEISPVLGGEQIIPFKNIFKTYQIQEFGNVLRVRLIKKWHSLGLESYSEKNTLLRQIDRSKTTVDIIIGKNLVPSHPFFLLTILQLSDRMSSNDLQKSAYGYYYEMLIVSALQQIDMRAEAIDAYKNFLAESAYQMFSNQSDSLPQNKFEEFMGEYAEKYDLKPYIKRIYEDVLRAELLVKKEDSVSFRYRYIFYFFVAKYLADRITQDYIRGLVKEMACKPFVKTYANIIMFMTYLSRDPFILDTICETAQSVFQDQPVVHLDEDVASLNELIAELPKLVIDEMIDVEQAREEKLRRQDKVESLDKQNGNNEEEFAKDVDDITELDIIQQINVSYKLAEILGQITKSYFGSLDRHRKQELIKTTYDLVLKPLSAVLELIIENRDALIRDIVEILRKQNLSSTNDREKIKAYARKFLFRLSCLLVYSSAKSVSKYVGTENISPTINRVLEDTDSTSYKIIDQAIRLDHFHDFPIKELKRLNKSLDTNSLAKETLRRLVIDYLYMFEINYQRRQQICNEFQIKIVAARQIPSQTRINKGKRD